MTRADVFDLLRQTLFQPRDAARRLIDLRLPADLLWMGLGLMAILNAIAYTLSLQMSPESDTLDIMMPPAFREPILFAAVLFGALALTVFALYYIGQGLGGEAVLPDILVLMTWLQGLRLLVQAAVVIITLGVPVLGALLVIAAALWGIYILVSFIDAAHRFDNRLRALGVIVLSFIGMAIALSTVLSLAGIVTSAGSSK